MPVFQTVACDEKHNVKREDTMWNSARPRSEFLTRAGAGGLEQAPDSPQLGGCERYGLRSDPHTAEDGA